MITESVIAAFTLLASLATLAIFIFVILFVIQGIDFVNDEIVPKVSNFALYILFTDLGLFLPLSFLKKTRKIAGIGFYVSSWIFLFTLWIFSFLLCYSIWGPYAAYLGIFLAGIGVFPIAVMALLVHGLWSIFLYMTLGAIIVLITKWFGRYLIEISTGKKITEKAGSPSP